MNLKVLFSRVILVRVGSIIRNSIIEFLVMLQCDCFGKALFISSFVIKNLAKVLRRSHLTDFERAFRLCGFSLRKQCFDSFFTSTELLLDELIWKSIRIYVCTLFNDIVKNFHILYEHKFIH